MAGVYSTLFSFSFLIFFLLNFIRQVQTIYPDENSNNGSRLLFKRQSWRECETKANLLTWAEKDYLVKMHTDLRESLKNKYYQKLPKAYFLRKLSWDDELAESAQKSAENCNTTRDLLGTLKNEPIGQNVVAVDERTGQSLNALVDKWAAGINHLNPEIIAKYRKPKPEEFDYEDATQMVWWNTTLIGCGRSLFKTCIGKKVENCTKTSMVKLVCNYFPAGNRAGEEVYVTISDRNLLCLYDDSNVLCKKMKFGKDKKNSITRNSAENRIRSRMIELWPAAGRATSISAKWNKHWFFIFIFIFITKAYY